MRFFFLFFSSFFCKLNGRSFCRNENVWGHSCSQWRKRCNESYVGRIVSATTWFPDYIPGHRKPTPRPDPPKTTRKNTLENFYRFYLFFSYTHFYIYTCLQFPKVHRERVLFKILFFVFCEKLCGRHFFSSILEEVVFFNSSR